MFASVFVLGLIAAVRGGCVPCAPNNGSSICTKGWQTSLYQDGECVFDSTVDFKKDVFVTGSVVTWGVCVAVRSKVGESCFKSMAGQVAARLAGSKSGQAIGGCETHMARGPCLIGEAKYTAYTPVSSVADCAVIDILYADAMEECLRNDADGRFWASFAYEIAIWLGLFMLIGCCGLATGFHR